MLPKIGFCSFLFVAFCLFCTPVHAADFKDLDAWFSYDGNETMTFKLCNSADSDITYYGGFEKEIAHRFGEVRHEFDSDKIPINTYAYSADQDDRKYKFPENPDSGHMVTLKAKECKIDKLPVPQRANIVLGETIRRYKFRFYLILYRKATLKGIKLPSQGDRLFLNSRPIIDNRPTTSKPQTYLDHVLFESPVYDYKAKIFVNETVQLEDGETTVYPLTHLDVKITQDGETSSINVCNTTDGSVVFRDHLYLDDPDKPPFGINLEYKTEDSSQPHFERSLFYPSTPPLGFKESLKLVKMPPGECRTKNLNVIPVVANIENQAAANGKSIKITGFYVRLILFEDTYDLKYLRYTLSRIGPWVDFQNMSQAKDALDYHNLTVEFKDSDEGLEIQVCNPKDKPVIFQDSLFLDQPKKKPFGVLVEVQYDGLLSNNEMFERVFYPVSLPRVREARMEPGECKSKTVDLGHALSVFLRDNEEYKQSGRHVMKYRAVVVLFENVWNFKYAKLPHRVFNSAWMRYNPTSMHDK